MRSRAARRGCCEPIDHGDAGSRRPTARRRRTTSTRWRCSAARSASTSSRRWSPSTRERFAEPPTTLADFFDLERFPGRRAPAGAARGQPRMGADRRRGAARRGLRRARDRGRARSRLRRARPDPRPGRLVARRCRAATSSWPAGQVAMSSAWNGRIFAEVEARGTPLGIVWDHQVWNMDVWAIPEGAANRAEAMDVHHLCHQRRAHGRAGQPDRLRPDPPLGHGPGRDRRCRPYLPTAEGRRDGAIRIDHAWWAARQAGMQARFDAWLRGGGPLRLRLQPRGSQLSAVRRCTGNAVCHSRSWPP